MQSNTGFLVTVWRMSLLEVKEQRVSSPEGSHCLLLSLIFRYQGCGEVKELVTPCSSSEEAISLLSICFPQQQGPLWGFVGISLIPVEKIEKNAQKSNTLRMHWKYPLDTLKLLVECQSTFPISASKIVPLWLPSSQEGAGNENLTLTFSTGVLLASLPCNVPLSGEATLYRWREKPLVIFSSRKVQDFCYHDASYAHSFGVLFVLKQSTLSFRTGAS